MINSRMFPRPQLLVFHRCLALIWAPLLFLQALTGTMILFRAELMRMTLPELTERPAGKARAPISTVITAASGFEPGYRAIRLFLPATDQDATFVQLAGPNGATRYIAIDPSNAQIIASGPIWSFPTEAALQIHYRLMDGRFGMAVILLNAVVLMMMSATGMLYWWPGRTRLIKALAIRSAAPPRARLRQWHRSIGVILTPLMLFSALTGVMLILPDLSVPASPPTTATAVTGKPSAQSIDQALTRAMNEFPGEQVRDIRLGTPDRMDVNLRALRFNSQAVDVVSIRLSDGSILKELSAERNLAPWITWLPLHSGTAMGEAGRILLLLEGIVLMILAITGPLMWWQARRAKRRKA